MTQFLNVLSRGILAGLAVALTAAVRAGGDAPNWKGSGTGTTRPDGGVDLDSFGGESSQGGRFAAEGYHVLNPVDFTFTGRAIWTAINGDTLDVTYAGQIVLISDPDFPFGFKAELVADGGSGGLSSACGRAKMWGAFTGVRGDFRFGFQGTLDAKEGVRFKRAHRTTTAVRSRGTCNLPDFSHRMSISAPAVSDSSKNIRFPCRLPDRLL
ncbi:MAG TPA: hypothetical protein VKE40_23180 [Gemmataceae bacterium]|nr:hypothetical protein [Gemmataceae bacterium]